MWGAEWRGMGSKESPGLQEGMHPCPPHTPSPLLPGQTQAFVGMVTANGAKLRLEAVKKANQAQFQH